MSHRTTDAGALRAALAAGIVVASLCVWLRPQRASGCAIVARSAVQIRAEEALIVWDAARHTEHFIRQASFARDGREPFGFLVPTPAQPELAEVDERVFDRLASLYRAPDPPPSRRRGRSIDDVLSAVPSAPVVVVVAVARVGGLDATVLRASDAQTLAQWLAQHGFSARPGLAAWLAGYVANGWYLTAFRYDGGGQPRFGSRAVRMSFRADRPVYPYAEPDDQPQSAARPLRVTVIGDARMEGELGGRPWAARTGYAARPRLASVLQGAVPARAVAPGAWMTTFEEPVSRRGANDLFFRRSAVQREVAPSIVGLWALLDPLDPPETPDRAAVRDALLRASSAVRACAAGSRGDALVTITFVSDGHVSDALVRGVASEPARACIEDVARRLVLPRFRRATFSISYPFRLD